MISAFSENYDKHLCFAYDICGCNSLKYDLVNEMYIKLHEALEKDPQKKINNGFVYKTIRNIYLNMIRDKKEFNVSDDFFNLLEYDQDGLEDRMEINNALENLSFFDREVLLKTQEMSLREIQKETGVHYLHVYYKKKESMEKLKSILNG